MDVPPPGFSNRVLADMKAGILHSETYLTYLRNTASIDAYITLYVGVLANSRIVENAVTRFTVQGANAARYEAQLVEAWDAFRKQFTSTQFLQMSREILVCRSVDVFDYYLTEMLRQVFTTRHEILKTSEKVEIRSVLEAGSMEEFIRRIAERRVLDLSYKGFADVIAYLNDNLGLKFDTSVPQFKAACEFLEVRNIIVHNMGRVSNRFLQSTNRTDLQVGDLYPLTDAYVLGTQDALGAIVTKLDAQFLSHFKIPPMRDEGTLRSSAGGSR